MSLSYYTQDRLKRGVGSSSAAQEIVAAIDGGNYGISFYVDPFIGSDANDGRTWATAFLTMSAALSAVATGGTIYFRGNVREQLVGSNLKFDVTIVGCGSLHHPDQPSSAYDPAGACWRAPASPTAATPLLEVRGRGWKFINVMFAGVSDAACVLLKRNALSDVSEYDASHATFLGCRFVDGKYAIEDSGGCYNVTHQECEYKAFTTCAIRCTSTAVANPLNMKVRDCRFPSNVSSFGNASHIIGAFNCAEIYRSIFGTVTSTALYIDLTGGNGNVVWDNILLGAYDTTDYVAGTGDQWYGNRCVVKATQAPDGVTILNPA